jgi:hypothetical protein
MEKKLEKEMEVFPMGLQLVLSRESLSGKPLVVMLEIELEKQKED